MATTDAIGKLDERIAQLKARRDQIVARERATERKRDTRRKVIAGGALFALVREGDEQARAVLARVLDGLPERSRPPFEGWQL